MLCMAVVRWATFSSVVCRRLWDVPGFRDQDVVTELHQPTIPSQMLASKGLLGQTGCWRGTLCGCLLCTHPREAAKAQLSLSLFCHPAWQFC